MSLQAPSRYCGINRLIVSVEMIERPRLVAEPRGRSRVTGAEAEADIDRGYRLLTAAREAQRDTEVEVAEGKVCVQIDRAACVHDRCTDVAGPKIGLCQYVMCLRVLGIKR